MATEEELKAAKQLILDHYGITTTEPVMPISTYCNKLYAWLDALVVEAKDPKNFEYNPNLQQVADNAMAIRLSIMKSAALDRTIYSGEDLRTRKCPIHNGHWGGIASDYRGGCLFGCDLTGWLPNGMDEEAISKMLEDRRLKQIAHYKKYVAMYTSSPFTRECRIKWAKEVGVDPSEFGVVD